MRFPEYGGLSYEQASRKADEVLMQFGWFQGFDRLEALRDAMEWADLRKQRGIEPEAQPEECATENADVARQSLIEGAWVGDAMVAAINVLAHSNVHPASISVDLNCGSVSQKWHINLIAGRE